MASGDVAKQAPEQLNDSSKAPTLQAAPHALSNYAAGLALHVTPSPQLSPLSSTPWRALTGQPRCSMMAGDSPNASAVPP